LKVDPVGSSSSLHFPQQPAIIGLPLYKHFASGQQAIMVHGLHDEKMTN
jgi:hypothetical protein